MPDEYTRTAGPALEVHRARPDWPIWHVKGKGFICCAERPDGATLAVPARCLNRGPDGGICDLARDHAGPHQMGGVNVWREW